MNPTEDQTAGRRAWMSLLAKAPEGRVAALLDGLGARPAFAWLRAPEVGSVMLRGRAGGTGAAFNLGEITVTRCALRLSDGTAGHAWVQGRRKADAEAAALVDAMLLTADAPRTRKAVLLPLETEAEARRSARAEKAAATQVDFFTLQRGED